MFDVQPFQLNRFVQIAVATMFALLVSLVGRTAHAGDVVTTEEAELIYNRTCVVCHGEGVGGAPQPGIKSDWEYRLSFGLEDVYLNAIEGLGPTMPPRGLCMDCSDAQVQAVVDLMTANLK